MLDRFNRKINYLRISVTDRCNLRCKYCMPEEGVKLFSHEEIIKYEEIIEFVKVAVGFGIDKVRITGGEPLIRKNISGLINSLSKISGINDLSITTNGILLSEQAQQLADSGLQRINISLDTTDSAKYKELTRGGDIKKVFEGIEAVKKTKLNPIKINCVIEKSVDELDAQLVKKYCKENNLEVRYIHRMNLFSGNYSVVEGGIGGSCVDCNRLRLSSNAILYPCLFNDLSFDIRKLGYENALKQAIEAKPECGTSSEKNKFYFLGG